MKIQEYLKSVRNEKIKIDLASISFFLLMISTGLLLVFLLLESVFYFSPFYKKIVLFATVILFVTIDITNAYFQNQQINKTNISVNECSESITANECQQAYFRMLD